MVGMVVLVVVEMFGKVAQAQVVLVAQETLHQHHQLKAQMVVQVVLTIQMMIIYKLAVVVEQVRQVKQVKQQLVAKAVMVRHLLFLDQQ
jgi:hypothetical protein